MSSQTECKAKMLRLLSARDYTVKGMSDKLRAYGFDEKTVDFAIEQALDSRLLDDMRYAQLYTEAKKHRGWGSKKIIAGLKHAGIDCKQIEGFLDTAFSCDEELDRAKKCLEKHRPNPKNPSESHFRFLMSRGYSASVCTDAVDYKMQEQF